MLLCGLVFCVLLSVLEIVSAKTECVWATGILECRKNQTRVLGAIVEIYDLDSPETGPLKNPLDPDDKVGVSVVDSKSGLWNVEGCASDQDWFPGLHNKPEFYIKIQHKCNRPSGETKRIFPVFRVYTPETYDHHINRPIVLDDDYDPDKEEDAGYEIVDIKNEGPKRFDIESIDSE
ncbi:hypothetical protein M3Y97_01027100 [Aphelenchoides bicaudatus]|nr:hypothetical protein M3Y97_01027100 [Aphelenchoides bicaudatus]